MLLPGQIASSQASPSAAVASQPSTLVLNDGTQAGTLVTKA